MGNKILKVSENYLNELFNKSSKALVGECMRRFEILNDKRDVKHAIKEKIYEHFRQLKTNIEAYNYGIKFTTKPDKE